jgi:hypothetical protein
VVNKLKRETIKLKCILHEKEYNNNVLHEVSQRVARWSIGCVISIGNCHVILRKIWICTIASKMYGCMYVKDLFRVFRNIIGAWRPLQKAKLFVPTWLSILFKQQPKVTVSVSHPCLNSVCFLYIDELVVVLNMHKIFTSGR